MDVYLRASTILDARRPILSRVHLAGGALADYDVRDLFPASHLSLTNVLV